METKTTATFTANVFVDEDGGITYMLPMHFTLEDYLAFSAWLDCCVTRGDNFTRFGSGHAYFHPK